MAPLVTVSFAIFLGLLSTGNRLLKVCMLMHDTSAPVSYNALILVFPIVRGTYGLLGLINEEDNLLMVLFIKSSNTVDKLLISFVDDGDPVGVLPDLSESLKIPFLEWLPP